ncbi:MAG: lamin tail domain-containing protein [Planctomycetota bacterium]|nr:lamin tail domain-containing protein [Planctomycetota bacterium]
MQRALCLLLLLCLAGCGGGAASPAATDLATPPLLTAVVPATGSAAGGRLVQLEGRGFDALAAGGAVYVAFGDTIARGEVQTDTLVVARLPCTQTLGVRDVRVTGAGLSVELAQAFTYVADPPRLVASPTAVAPDGGTREPTRIDITGATFGTAPEIRFGTDGDEIGTLLTWRADRLTVALTLSAADVGREIPIRVVDGALDAVVRVRVVAAPAPGDVFLGELHPHPDRDLNGDGYASTAGDEFVELVNARTTPLDLSGCTLEDATALRHVFPNATVVPPGGTLVLFGSGTPLGFAPRHADGQAQAATAGSLGLNNTSDAVALYDASGLELFRVAYASSTPGRSWHPVDEGASYIDGAPTPGAG